MNNVDVEHPARHEPVHDEKWFKEHEKSLRKVVGGSTAEAMGGIATVILAILGLIGLAPVYMAAIAVLVLGAAFFFQGSSIAAWYREFFSQTDSREAVELGRGMTVEFASGIAGMVLGILTLLGLVPGALLPIAVIVYGATFLLSSGAMPRIEREYRPEDKARETAQLSQIAAFDAQMFIGLGCVILGILALVGVNPLVLILVALLSMGCSALLSGTVASSEMMPFLRVRRT